MMMSSLPAQSRFGANEAYKQVREERFSAIQCSLHMWQMLSLRLISFLKVAGNDSFNVKAML